MNKYDIVIVGGGIMGIAHAYHCLQLGLKVALIEKNEFPRDATVRNFGQIVPSGMNTKWQNYGRESLRIYKEIQAEYDISVRQQGSVYLASDPEEMTLLEELATINQGNNYPSELWTKDQCLRSYPGLKSTYVRGGLFFPEEINIDPRVAAARIIKYSIEKFHLHYHPGTLIKNIIRANGEVILTTAGGDFLRAGKVFLCSGSEFQMLYPGLFAVSDLILVKLQMLSTVPQIWQKIHGSVLTGWTIRRYESFQECPSYWPIKAKEAKNSYQQKYGIHILFKQNADGSVIIGDTHEYAPAGEAEKLSFDIQSPLNDYVIAEAKKILDLENWQIEKSWLGFYSQCKNEDVYKKTIDDHVHIVTGIGGKGMTASLGFARENVHKHLSINIQHH
jgi:FAD dependent oxidoreductase TIGR03364